VAVTGHERPRLVDHAQQHRLAWRAVVVCRVVVDIELVELLLECGEGFL
jgi:hypothetical protein